jgi:hypothetical protein
MKKRNLTMDKQIGIYGLALLVFMVICGSQDVLALSDVTTNTISLNVNAATQVAPALTKGKVNQFTYVTSSSGILQNVYTNWAEKAVFGSVVAAPATATAVADVPVDAEVKLTVTIKSPATTITSGDLIIKVDQMIVSTGTTGSAFNVHSSWMKYAYSQGPFSTTSSAISLFVDGDTVTGAGTMVTKSDITTLPLVRYGSLQSAGVLPQSATTLTLLDFSTKMNLPAQIIITAILVDSVDSALPQVMGVDVKTIFFNYVDPAVAARSSYAPIWLSLIQAGGSYDFFAPLTP